MIDQEKTTLMVKFTIAGLLLIFGRNKHKAYENGIPYTPEEACNAVDHLIAHFDPHDPIGD